MIKLLRKTRANFFSLADFRFFYSNEPIVQQVAMMTTIFKNHPETVDSKEVLDEIYLFHLRNDLFPIFSIQQLHEDFVQGVNNIYQRSFQIDNHSALKMNYQMRDYLSEVNREDLMSNIEPFLEEIFSQN